METFQFHATINNQTPYHLRVQSKPLETGKFMHEPQEIPPMAEQEAFVASGLAVVPSGPKGKVVYQVGDDAKQTVEIDFFVPIVLDMDNTMSVQAASGIKAATTGFTGSGASEAVTVRVSQSYT
ncbi:MAG TPA: hypothetical protein VFE86_02250 [Ilumatobacteraceae bacterium]|nr:hypothetical protein [Ilumatobacteraceae bacterium]